jgi:hypothetical protein
MNIGDHMGKSLLFTLAALSLAGCASVGDLRQKGPAETFHASKSAEAMAECITAAWNDVKIAGSPPAIRTQHIGDVYSVLSGPSNIIEMVDVAPYEDESTVKFYRARGLADWRERRFTDAIKPCL